MHYANLRIMPTFGAKPGSQAAIAALELA